MPSTWGSDFDAVIVSGVNARFSVYNDTVAALSASISLFANKYQPPQQQNPAQVEKLDKKSYAYFDSIAQLGRQSYDPTLKRKCLDKMAKFMGLDSDDSSGEGA